MTARHGVTRLWPWATQEAEALGGKVQGFSAQLSKILSKNVKCSKQGHGGILA